MQSELARLIFDSIVRISYQKYRWVSSYDLLAKAVHIGKQYRGMIWLGQLSRARIVLEEIPFAGHLIMHISPLEMWKRIAQLATHTETKVSHH